MSTVCISTCQVQQAPVVGSVGVGQVGSGLLLQSVQIVHTEERGMVSWGQRAGYGGGG